MRVLVTGSRQLLDQGLVYAELDRLFDTWMNSIPSLQDEEFVVVHGAAPGADTLAGQWAWDRRNHEFYAPIVEIHPAEWNRYGRHLAGGIRNAKMVGLGADLVLAFFQPGAQNRGTTNCMNQAKLAGLRVKEIWANV